MKRLPANCPSCEKALVVSQLSCESCGTAIAGTYVLPVMLQLSADEQDFMLEFILSSGSLKQMESKLKKSYPTVRNMLDDLITKIITIQKSKP